MKTEHEIFSGYFGIYKEYCKLLDKNNNRKHHLPLFLFSYLPLQQKL
jgi:hypothetical protein